jgi:hypothetical protein
VTASELIDLVERADPATTRIVDCDPSDDPALGIVVIRGRAAIADFVRIIDADARRRQSRPPTFEKRSEAVSLLEATT